MTTLVKTLDSFSPPRRYDLDWLRTIVILNLIPYHAAFLMLAVPEFSFVETDGWVATLLGVYLVICTPLHMPLMFMIAGYSMTIAIARKSLRSFLLERIQRLAIPLIVLTIVLMPIAAYALPVLAQVSPPGTPSLADYLGRYWPQIMANFFTVGITGGPLWLHLWFVAYLGVMTAIATPILYRFKRCLSGMNQETNQSQSSQPFTLEKYLLCLPFLGFLIAFFLAQFFPFYRFNLIKDWAYFFYNATSLSFGILLALRPQMSSLIQHYRTKLTITAVITLILRLVFSLYGTLQFDVDLPEVYATELPSRLYLGYAIAAAANTCATILALWGWGQTRFNKASTILTYLSQRSYSYYIWHFVILCIVGHEIVRWRWNIAAEFTILCVATAIGTFLADETIVRRWVIGRKLFGVKLVREM
jgi:peptidoglycan/LPS O-acetylase OafA/YrhL